MKPRANIASLHDYLSSFKKDKPIYLASVKREITNLFHKEISVNVLEAYFQEKGYTKIQLNEPERKSVSKGIQEEVVKNVPVKPGRKPVIDDDDDEDFDPNAFIKQNKEKIQQTAIESSTYKENTWIIEKYKKESTVEVLNELLVKNRGLVELVANRYMKHTSNKLDYDDLVSEGYLGLMKAIERFDTSLGHQFSTYATWWIRQSITRAIMDKGYTIRVPVHMHEAISKVLKFERHSILIFDEVNVKWVAEQADITEERYHELKKVDHMFLHLASLDIVVSEEDNDTSLLDFLEYKPHIGLGSETETFLNPEELAIKGELKLLLEECLEELKEREREVLKLRFGWHDNEIKTLEDIGRIFGVTRERIRQIESKALNKIYDKAGKRNLKEYFS